MGHLVRQASLFDGGDGVATTDDGDTVQVGQSVRDRKGTLGEGVHFKHAHRTVPDDRLALVQFLLEGGDGVRSDVQTHPAIRDRVDGDNLRVGIRGELVRDDDVSRQEQLDALLFRFRHQSLGEFNLVVFNQRGTDGFAQRLVEGEDHTTAQDDLVRLGQEGLDDANLGGDLGAADDGAKRSLRVLDGAVEVVQLLLEQETGNVRLAGASDTSGGGMRSVRSTESIVDEDFGGASQLLGEPGVVGFFFLVESSVFQQAHGAVGHAGDSLLNFRADAVVDLGDQAGEQFGQSRANRGQAELVFRARLRSAKVRARQHLGAVLDQVFDGRDGGADARVVGDVHVAVERDVEIASDEDSLTCCYYCFRRRRKCIIASVQNNYYCRCSRWSFSLLSKISFATSSLIQNQ